jgi:two-component system response regulator RegA
MILLVDDDDIFRCRLAQAFNDRGFNTCHASNISQAYENFIQYRPSYSVIDLKLADQSGLTLLSKLLEEDASIKAVLLTGYGTISTTVQALKIGAINYLTKPTDADSILKALGLSSYNQIKKQKLHSDQPDLAQVEWNHINQVLNDCSGNITKAAKLLGLHRRSLQRKLQKQPFRLK